MAELKNAGDFELRDRCHLVEDDFQARCECGIELCDWPSVLKHGKANRGHTITVWTATRETLRIEPDPERAVAGWLAPKEPPVGTVARIQRMSLRRINEANGRIGRTALKRTFDEFDREWFDLATDGLLGDGRLVSGGGSMVQIPGWHAGINSSKSIVAGGQL